MYLAYKIAFFYKRILFKKIKNIHMCLLRLRAHFQNNIVYILWDHKVHCGVDNNAHILIIIRINMSFPHIFLWNNFVMCTYFVHCEHPHHVLADDGTTHLSDIFHRESSIICATPTHLGCFSTPRVPFYSVYI